MSELVFIGTGEAFDPALPNTSALYRGRVKLLLDCGYSVPHALWKVTTDPDHLDGVFISHIHADHSFGLPALLGWMRDEGRQRPMRILGGAGVGRWLERLLDMAYPGSFTRERCFPIEAIELVPGTPYEWDGVRLDTALSEHSVKNLAIRIEEAGESLCYSGDGALSAATAALYQGANVLVHECYAADHDTRGHARADRLLEFCRAAAIGRLCLLHVSRQQKTEVSELVRALAADLDVLLPKPGDIVRWGASQ